jgi:flagellar motor switch/type III secretory pathway protein FliN
MSKTKRKPKPYFYSGEPKAGTEEETEDIYNSKQREQMLDDDEITAAEEGFMKGREDEPPNKKQTRKNAINHVDQVSVELAKEDAEED